MQDPFPCDTARWGDEQVAPCDEVPCEPAGGGDGEAGECQGGRRQHHADVRQGTERNGGADRLPEGDSSGQLEPDGRELESPGCSLSHYKRDQGSERRCS